MAVWHDVASTSDVEEGGVISVVAGTTRVALFRLNGEFFALRDRCSHGAAILSRGYVDGDCIECPLHQGLIAIKTGEPRSAPVTDPVASYPARIVDGRIEVAIS